MKPHRTPATILILLALGFVVMNLSGSIPAARAQVQVTAANPSSTAQGTINLNVKVTGKGFKNGAKAKWFVTGTTDPGGVTVNSTAFVNSSEVDANITVSDTAVIANFDIQVLNSDGRGGKGTELFAVTSKGGGNVTCPAMQPAPTSDTKCYAALPGCLDSTFGGVGFVHNDLDASYVSGGDEADGVAVQPDGKIVVAGRVRISSTDINFAVIRYNVDSSLDTSFGDPDPSNPPFRRGYALTAISTGFDYTHALALQPDGRIVVSGSGGGEGVVVRYNSDGTVDTGFGSGGIAHLGSGAPSSDLALQADGKIIIGGAAGAGFALARLSTNGSLDSSFGSGGQVSVNPSGAKNGSGAGWSVAIQRVPAVTGEERIVLAGWSKLSLSANLDWTLMRFRSNGATDTTFGTSGIVKTYFSGFGDQARRVRIDSSNRIVAAGIIRSASSSCGSYVVDYAVVRYLQDGGLDGSFAGGRQTVDIYGGDDNLGGLALQADGRILLFGNGSSSDNSVPNDGKIIAAGGAYLVPPHSQGEIVVARYWP